MYTTLRKISNSNFCCLRYPFVRVLVLEVLEIRTSETHNVFAISTTVRRERAAFTIRLPAL
jgi:hypothetical protein